jgi:hypothetical protein
VRSAYWVRKVTDAKAKALAGGVSSHKFDNELCGTDINLMSKAHMMYMSFAMSRKYVEEQTYKCSNLKGVFCLLLEVFALKQLTLDSMPLQDTGYLRPGDYQHINDAYKTALKRLRPQMIGLAEYKADILDNHYTDISSIGNQYGDIYEHQLNCASESPLNKQQKPAYFDDVVMPIIRGGELKGKL